MIHSYISFVVVVVICLFSDLFLFSRETEARAQFFV